ncbi:hypothetical protein [Kamptonema formosum]|nr:hypothetical protein [Oscillatoria sp. PCC 10802]
MPSFSVFLCKGKDILTQVATYKSEVSVFLNAGEGVWDFGQTSWVNRLLL